MNKKFFGFIAVIIIAVVAAVKVVIVNQEMKKIIVLYLCGLMISSCQSNQKKVERLDVQLSVIYRDLETSLPGELIVMEKCLILSDPFATSEYIKVLDKQTGEKIFGFLDIGQGPNEFNMPRCDISTGSNVLTVFDLNVKKILECDIDSLIEGKTPPRPGLFPFTDIICLAKYKPKQYVATLFTGSKPFAILKDNEIIFEFGKYPFSEKITNLEDVFQGTTLYNVDRQVLGYATFNTPYLSLYKSEADTFRLLWESRFRNAHYSISNSELRYDKEQPAGINGLAFAKDYIVCLVKEMRLKESIGRMKEQMAKSVYIYNYEGELVKILDLDMHTLRISAMSDSNVVYFVGLDEEYCLMKLDLGKYD
ncbi:MAG: TolB-like 6-bladed beta-propeller domain-containing protein [Tannerella sp.]|jgi:hypothetical protein|nr:TolB-like 6-bladed beta-propeller domain-containing protein [Tannerella sp.]